MDFSKYALKGNAFLADISSEIGASNDIDRAGRILRSVFHVLRDVISKEESFQLISQFPMALKSVYVDGWTFKHPQEHIKHMDDFIEAVVKKDSPAGYCSFASKKEAKEAIEAVFRVLKKHVSKGEIEDVRATLPKELKPLCDV
jgi:uncharacterized protein (DUF2267 family)